MRSFRFLLAVRITLAMTAAVGAVAVLSFLGLRQGLDSELDASLLNVAKIQAAAVTEDPAGEMNFPEWELTPEEAASVRELNRYAQIWSADGTSLVRGRYITEDLPLDTSALARAADDEVVWARGVFQGSPIRSLYYPLERMGELHNRHVLQVAAPLEARNRVLRRVGLLLLGILGTITATTFVGAWWLAGRMVRPVDAIIDQAEGIARGEPQRKIEAFADTWEYHRLVQGLNRMLNRLDVALDTQKRFAADASHELRTPLTALRGQIEVALRRGRTPEEYVAVLDSALEESERLSRLTEDLLTLTRSEAGVLHPQIQEVDLSERVRRTVELLSPEAEGKEIHIIGPGLTPVLSQVDPDLFDRVVWNLLGNAVSYSSPGGQVEIRLKSTPSGAVFEVADTGPGIPEHQLEAVFERFFRTDESRTHHESSSGTGLGLAIARVLVDLHGGSIEAKNRPGGGALFRVTLPSSKKELPVV
jgi:two-component system OmpR family sensor kinase